MTAAVVTDSQQQDQQQPTEAAPVVPQDINSNSTDAVAAASGQFVAANSYYCSSPSYITTASYISTNPYGTNYVNYQSCVWYIVAPFGQVPRLTFTSFRTESNYDFVTVYNGYGTLGNSQLLRVSGSGIPSAVTGTSQYMTVQFTTDSSVTFSGMTASVSFVSLGTCSSPTYISYSGTTIDTNPTSSFYANGQSCTWYITAPSGYAPRITFNHFNTESNYDFFTVYNGPSTWYNQLLRTSGTSIPSPVTATQNSMTVTFNADHSFTSTGVLATVTFIPMGTCSSPSYITTSGTTISTNPGTLSYANGQACSWTIVAPYGYRPQLVFSSFATEAGYDFFGVYDGWSTSSPSLLYRSGGGVPGAVTASQEAMVVTFNSDSIITDFGVTAYVYFV